MKQLKNLAYEGIITVMNRSRLLNMWKSRILQESGHGGTGLLSKTANLPFMLSKKAKGSKLMVQGRY